MKINRLLIYGCGLVGGSLALTLKKHHPHLHIEGVSRSQESINFALQNGVLDHGATSLEHCTHDVDLAIIATPISQTSDDIAKVSAHITSPCIITDVASVKEGIQNKIADVKNNHTVILGHPMAGSDKTGVQNANKTIMQGAKYILVPQNNERYLLLKEFLTLSGFQILEMTAVDHDLRAAYASHIPYLMATLTTKALLSLPEDTQNNVKDILAKGFADTTRVAGSDPSWGQDICQHNKNALIQALSQIESDLSDLKQNIETGNMEPIKNLLEKVSQFKHKG